MELDWRTRNTILSKAKKLWVKLKKGTFFLCFNSMLLMQICFNSITIQLWRNTGPHFQKCWAPQCQVKSTGAVGTQDFRKSGALHFILLLCKEKKIQTNWKYTMEQKCHDTWKKKELSHVAHMRNQR